MIWPRETVLLAGTKLKTRKIRLIVTIIITAVLFSVLVFLASMTDGVVRSLRSFGQEGYGNRFFVQATPLTYQSYGPGSDQELKDKFGVQQRDLIARKKAAAKKLGVAYDETTDPNLPLQVVKTGPNTTETYPNLQSELVLDYFNDKAAATPGTAYQDFQRLATDAGAAATYSGTQSGTFFGGPGASTGQAAIIVDGREDLGSIVAPDRNGPPDMSGIASIATLGWRNIDSELLAPFVLPEQTMATGKDRSIPVVAPYSAAEEILGLKKLPDTATPKQRLDRLTEVRQGIAGKTAQLCHRNAASIELLVKAAEQQKEIEANKNNKEYTQPALVYGLPADACGTAVVKTDKRTAEEKKEALNLKAFDEQFGQAQEPAQGMLAIRIIGVTPDIEYAPTISPTTILSSLLTANIGAGWVSPAKAVEQNTLANTIQGGTAGTVPRGMAVYYAEFDSLPKMEKFIKSQTCDDVMNVQGPDGTNMAIEKSQEGGGTAACIAQQKVFTVSPYGNSAGAVERFRAGIWKVAKYAVLVIVAIAALIMMGNVGKIIADSRRETAVFRSLGAKRLDIAQIYLTYTVMISLLVALCAVVIGSVAAYVLSSRYSPELSVSAVLAYNALDVDKTFSLFGFNPLYVLAVVGLAVLAGLLSALLPLLANTRRNPIRDMRDDS